MLCVDFGLRNTGRDQSIQRLTHDQLCAVPFLDSMIVHVSIYAEVCRTEHLTEYVVLNVEPVQKSEAPLLHCQPQYVRPFSVPHVDSS